MTIYLDFDGTLVEHEYPKIGREVPHSMRVVERLKNAGHQIVLNTYRANIAEGEIKKAIEWFNYHPHYVIMLDGSTTQKIHPMWEPDLSHQQDILFIDDQATGIPLIPAVMTQGKMVDWITLEKILEEHKIL